MLVYAVICINLANNNQNSGTVWRSCWAECLAYAHMHSVKRCIIVLSTGGGPGWGYWWDGGHCNGWEWWELFRWAQECLRCYEEPGGPLQRPALCGPKWKRSVHILSIFWLLNLLNPLTCRLQWEMCSYPENQTFIACLHLVVKSNQTFGHTFFIITAFILEY